MRIHLFEFEDLTWFPDTIRRGGTDYLKYFLAATRFYEPVVPLIRETLERTGKKEILDLCSGGGGPIEQIAKKLNADNRDRIPVCLSDKFPNTEAFRYISEKSDGTIGYLAHSIDATAIPQDQKGLRTMFSAVHHFSPEIIRDILRNAVVNKAPVALFDGGDRNLFTILGIILFHPLAFVICTPFFRPFRFSRLLFTYILPLIPITTVWDGCVSILRLYSPDELLAIAEKAGDYNWKAGKVKNRLGMRVTYLIGYPAN